jgi:hypothetical protein
MSTTSVEQPKWCPNCNSAGPFSWAAQWYRYDDQHPLRHVEPASALVAVTTTWFCSACRHRFRIETKKCEESRQTGA